MKTKKTLLISIITLAFMLITSFTAFAEPMQQVLAPSVTEIKIGNISVDINSIPLIKEGQKVTITGTKSLIKEDIGNGKFLIHEIIVKENSPKNTNNANIASVNNREVYYTINDYVYDPLVPYPGYVYMGTCELDTTWFYSSGSIISYSNNCWGSVPPQQLPNYWSCTDDFNVYSSSQGVSYGYATIHYLLPIVNWPIGYRTYNLQTYFAGDGNYSNDYYITY